MSNNIYDMASLLNELGVEIKGITVSKGSQSNQFDNLPNYLGAELGYDPTRFRGYVNGFNDDAKRCRAVVEIGPDSSFFQGDLTPETRYLLINAGIEDGNGYAPSTGGIVVFTPQI